MSYRKECIKIYKKINSISQKGLDASFDYYAYIDELIDNGQYAMLEDVMITKYNIDIQNFKSIYDLKHKTFDKIRISTTSLFQENLKKLFDKRNVYPIGFHFYDKTNNHYLGDIKEIEEPADWIAYKDPKLSEKQDQITVINLEVTSGLEQSVIEAIPPFVADRTDVFTIEKDELVRYVGNIYECTETYTYTQNTPITPTYSNYWMQIYSPTYSYTLIDDNNVKLIDKYDQAISIVKSFIYLDPTG
jgi:hypothetical protein